MLRGVVIFSALLPLLGGAANAESVKIGSGEFEIINAEKMIEGRAVIFAVDLRYRSESGTAEVKSVIYCTTRKGEYYDANGRLTSVKIDPAERNTSITNHVWFKYCPGVKGLSKRELRSFSRYD